MAIINYPHVPYIQKELIDDGTYGPYPNRRAFEVNGFVENVDNVRVDVTNIGGTTPQKYVFPPAGGIQMRVRSDNAADDGSPAGTGAQTVHIHYLDANYAVQAETITMNGTTAVNTTATDILRVNSFHVTAVGTNGECVGNVFLEDTAGTVIYARIDAGYNSARNAVFTIPAGKQGFISHWSAYSGSAGTHYTRITLRSTAHENVHTPGVFLVKDTIGAENGGQSTEEDIPFHCPEKTDIKVSCVSDAATANAFVNAHISGWYE